tara:strand:- start:597 stop:806 length:210 start_codon:yes stop_codon:yes gene_type:complete
MLRNSKSFRPSIKKMSQLNYLELKLFLNLSDAEIAEVLENIEDLQHIETFRELKKEILLKYESQKTLSL